MKGRHLVVVLGTVLVAGVLFGISAQQKARDVRLPLDKHRVLGTPKTFQNLTLIPVYAPGAKATNTFMTLDEGLKAKVVKVREGQGGGSVNTLYITNLGKKPLYIMAGEVVLGGQQDRSLGTDTIIPPDEKEVPVTAFCVEHGRWNGEADFDKSAKAIASAEVRASVQDGAFIASRGERSSGVIGGLSGPAGPAGPPGAQADQRIQTARPAQRAGRHIETQPPAALSTLSVGRSQQEVWDKVAQKNRKFKADQNNATGTYRLLLDGEAGEAQKSIEPYMKAFEKGLDADPKLVGAMVAINGKVVAADIFGDPGLFRKLWPKLIRSYASDAAEYASAPEAKKKTVVTTKMGKDFFASATDGKSKAVNKSKVSATTRLDSKSALLYHFETNGKAAPGAAGGFGGFGGGGLGVHTNVIGK